jgi:hypothetical protein
MMIRTKAQLKNVELELKPISEQKVENVFVAAPLFAKPPPMLAVVFHSQFV